MTSDAQKLRALKRRRSRKITVRSDVTTREAEEEKTSRKDALLVEETMLEGSVGRVTSHRDSRENSLTFVGVSDQVWSAALVRAGGVVRVLRHRPCGAGVLRGGSGFDQHLAECVEQRRGGGEGGRRRPAPTATGSVRRPRDDTRFDTSLFVYLSRYLNYELVRVV